MHTDGAFCSFQSTRGHLRLPPYTSSTTPSTRFLSLPPSLPRFLSIFVSLSCEAFDPVEVYNLTVAFLGDLKRRKPGVPVLFLEGHPEGAGWINAEFRTRQNRTQEAFRRAYNTLLATGVKGLYYGRGERKFGGKDMATDFEAQASTVAGVHPPPLALRSIAVHVSEVVKAILNGTAAAPTLIPTGGVWPPSALPAQPPVHASAASPLPGQLHAARPALIKQVGPFKWVDAATLGVEGKGFQREAGDASFWQRLPHSSGNNGVRARCACMRALFLFFSPPSSSSCCFYSLHSLAQGWHAILFTDKACAREFPK